MSETEPLHYQRVIATGSPEETEALARMLALWLRPGFTVLLSGDLGAGKSLFARALIRAVAQDDTLEVPSPSFALVQHYDELRVPIIHADLYRLKSVEEVRELGLADQLANHALIVEWPDLTRESLPESNFLTIHFSGRGQSRDLTLEAHGKWATALRRNELIESFLAQAKGGQCRRQFLQGDASTRRYEFIDFAGTRSVLMDMPARSDGNMVRHGKSYSALVHLADDIAPVLAINRHLHALGYSAPVIEAADPRNGLAIIEWLDGELHGTMMQRGDDMRGPMMNAVAVLADMARRDWPADISSADGVSHHVPQYDIDAQLFEVDLMPTWFWPQLFGTDAPAGIRQSLEEVWRSLLPMALPQRPMWMLRDYHSPNLIWMPRRQGLQRTGIIDTQDAVMGHPAYDLVSLLQDARIDVPFDFQAMLYAHYVELRRGDSGFDAQEFERAYAILGAQRASRLLGTFTRLSKRDGKHHYLQHRPRVARYLLKNLEHPALLPLQKWYVAHLPEVFKIASS
jgi:tRNA threonylcarbamoyl adenosine modification protein YjeE